jgi:signal transduction histidine kinase
MAALRLTRRAPEEASRGAPLRHRLPLASLRLLPPLVWIALAAVLCLTLAIAAFSELSAQNAQQANAQIAQVLHRLQTLSEVRALIVDAETGQRGYLLTGDTNYLEPFALAARDLPAALDRLRRLCEGTEAYAAFARMSTLIAERLEEATRVVQAYDSPGNRAEAIALMRATDSRQIMEDIRAELSTLDALSRAELDRLQSGRIAAARWSRASLLVATALTLTLLLVLSRRLAAASSHSESRRAAAEHEARALERLVQARTQELSELSTHLQSVAEKEKSELARDLHDELGGLLTAAKMDLSWLQGRLDEPVTQQRLAQLGSALDEAMGVKRRVVENLRPSLLEHFGLATALRAYLEAASRKAALQCELKLDESADSLGPSDTAIALFRVVQEAFTNVVRHAGATCVRVELECGESSYRLTIVDDGHGFDPASSRLQRSHGITGMRHRVRALGGLFELESAPGRGTVLRAEVPRGAAYGERPEVAQRERASATSGLSSAMSRILSRK